MPVANTANAQRAMAAVSHQAQDLGGPGPDRQFGRGLVGADLRTPPADVQDMLSRCQDRRDFGAVRTALRQWHAAFAREMPIVPLWHLDTHVLLASGLTTVPPAQLLDPLAPFTHVEQWSIK